jgi:hypothetical protein
MGNSFRKVNPNIQFDLEIKEDKPLKSILRKESKYITNQEKIDDLKNQIKKLEKEYGEELNNLREKYKENQTDIDVDYFCMSANLSSKKEIRKLLDKKMELIDKETLNYKNDKKNLQKIYQERTKELEKLIENFN